jgi:GSH-dependent disulfide-bond oxidoreductase
LDKAFSQVGRAQSIGGFRHIPEPMSRRQQRDARMEQHSRSVVATARDFSVLDTLHQPGHDNEMTIELHTWNTPNGRKISVALEEMGLPYRVFPVDITKGEQMAPAFLAISPNNKIPAIVDPDGPGGQRVSVFESGAILLYLGEKTGKFLPASLMMRIPVLEWLMWQMGGFGPMPGQVHHFIALESEHDRAYGLKRYMTETRRLYGVLDRRLATHEFVADALSVADFAILGWAWRHERHKVSFADFPHVGRWYETLMARPGVKRGIDAKLD